MFTEHEKFGLLSVPHWLENNDPLIQIKDAPPHSYDFREGDFFLRVVENDIWADWALLSWAGESESGDDVRWELVAHGTGVSSNLREPRHTWFGDGDGYLFYVDPKILAWGFKILEKWFDFD